MNMRRNDDERRQWVLNFEPLWRTFGQSKFKEVRAWVSRNRKLIDEVIDRELNRKPLA